MNQPRLRLVKDRPDGADADYAAGLANTRAFAKAAPLDGNVSVPTQVLLRLLFDHDSAVVAAGRADYLQKTLTGWCCAFVDVAKAAGVDVGSIEPDALAVRLRAHIQKLEEGHAWLSTQLEDAKAHAAILTGFGR